METMASLSTLLPLITTQAVGVPVPLALQALRQATGSFCRKTRVWRHDITIQTTEEGQNLVETPDHLVAFEIAEAYWSDEYMPLTVIPPNDADRKELASVAASGAPPNKVTMQSRDTVTVIPKAVGDLHLTVYLMPTNGTADVTSASAANAEVNMVPLFIITDHGEAIASGALARLFAMPKKDWSDPQQAAYHGGIYSAAEADNDQAHVKTKAGATKRPPIEWF